MKCIVIGGTGRIGSQVVSTLRSHGHDVVAASPRTGVDALSGGGLPEALAGAAVVVDVSNAPSFADAAVMEFFTTSTGHLLREGAAAGVRHHVALSVVGCDRVPDSGYLRAKAAQERLITQSPIPYTIVRATQFFEFVGSIVEAATNDGTVRVPPYASGRSLPPTSRRRSRAPPRPSPSTAWWRSPARRSSASMRWSGTCSRPARIAAAS